MQPAVLSFFSFLFFFYAVDIRLSPRKYQRFAPADLSTSKMYSSDQFHLFFCSSFWFCCRWTYPYVDTFSPAPAVLFPGYYQTSRLVWLVCAANNAICGLPFMYHRTAALWISIDSACVESDWFRYTRCAWLWHVYSFLAPFATVDVLTFFSSSFFRKATDAGLVTLEFAVDHLRSTV